MEENWGTQDPEWGGVSSRWGPPGAGAPGVGRGAAPGVGRGAPGGAVGDGRGAVGPASPGGDGRGRGEPMPPAPGSPASPGGDGSWFGLNSNGERPPANGTVARFSDEQIAACAAAAIETKTPSSASKTDADVLKKIQDAQHAAERRRSGGGRGKGSPDGSAPGSPSTAPMYGKGSPATSSQASAVADIRAAQLKAQEQWFQPQQQASAVADIRAAQLQAQAAKGSVNVDSSTVSSSEEATARIKAAQLEAAKKKPDAIAAAQQEAYRKQGDGLNNMIWNAQQKNIPAAQAEAMAAPKWTGYSPLGCGGYYDAWGGIQDQWLPAPGTLPTPQGLLGNWVDVEGNVIRVYSTDAWELRLMASIWKPNKPDMQFAIRPTEDGTGWYCGSNTMDVSSSSVEQLTWLTPNGQSMVWVRGRE